MIQMNANGHLGCLGMRYHLRADDLDGHNGIMRLRMVYNYGDVQFFRGGDDPANGLYRGGVDATQGVVVLFCMGQDLFHVYRHDEETRT